MKIASRATDYALLMLLDLAKNDDGDELLGIKSLALKLGISVRFLANIANKLTIARILISHRGSNGGVRLAQKPNEISVRQVIEAVDGPIQTMFCQNTVEACLHQPSCQMKFFWDDLQTTVMDRLDSTSLATLLKNQARKFSPKKTKTRKLAHVASSY